jgi:diguanylate cyclase (GGDEF)-like protein
MELRSDAIEEIKLALKMEYFGAPFMSAFWLLMSYKYLFRKSASMNLTLLIMLVPAITLFLNVTNEYHHLIYTDISSFTHNGYLLALLEKGPWYYVNILYAYSVQIFGMAVFFRAWRTRGFQFRTQAFWLFLGSIWPGVVNLIYVAGFSPLNLDLTPFGLSVSGFCFCVALFRYGFLELQEIVRDVAFLEIGEGILVIDDGNRLIDFNQACREIFNWLDVIHIGIDIGIFPEGKKILAQSDQHFEMMIMRGRDEKWYEFRRTPLQEKKNRLGSVYFIQDISKQKEMIQTLHDIASYDSLTEIYNRRRLMEELEKELHHMKRYGQCISVLMIDIDHFKLVNDQYGHQAGDEVLKTLAAVCKERIRQTDTIGRYGGEEFLAVLPETNEEHALFVAEGIRNSIAEQDFRSNGSVINITVSIGVRTVYGYEENQSVDSVIAGADRALYHAKNNGRNRASAIDFKAE